MVMQQKKAGITSGKMFIFATETDRKRWHHFRSLSLNFPLLFVDDTERGRNGFSSTGRIIICDDKETKELLLEIDTFLEEN